MTPRAAETEKKMPTAVSQIFANVDLIFHAGDVGELWVLDELSRLALIIAAIGDYAGHLWGRESPHPVWAPLIFIGLGFLLLFPEKLGVAVEYAKTFLPWGKDK